MKIYGSAQNQGEECFGRSLNLALLLFDLHHVIVGITVDQLVEWIRAGLGRRLVND